MEVIKTAIEGVVIIEPRLLRIQEVISSNRFHNVNLKKK